MYATDTAKAMQFCPLCQQRMDPWLTIPGDWRRPGLGVSYRLYRCKHCRFGQLLPRPAPWDIQEFYCVESYYTHSARTDASTARARQFWERLRVRLSWQFDFGIDLDARWIALHLKPTMRVCDLGCGNGYLLSLLSENGLQCVGVEPDAEARAVAQEQGLNVLPGTAESLPAQLGDERFDVVVLSHVLEHCLDPPRALCNAAALSRGGGVVVAEVPNNDAIGLQQDGIVWPWLDVPRHLNFFNTGSLVAMIERAGMRIEAIEYTGYTRQFLPDWIEMQRQIAGAFSHLPGNEPNHKPRPWQLLFRTLLARRDRKYDSVRVIARAPK